MPGPDLTFPPQEQPKIPSVDCNSVVELVSLFFKPDNIYIRAGTVKEEGEEEEDDPDFDPSKVKPGQNAQECKQQ